MLAWSKWPGTELVRRRWKKTRVVPGLGKTSISSRWPIFSIRSLIPLIHDDFLVFDFQSWYSSQGSQHPKYPGDQSRLGCSCLSATGTWTFLIFEEEGKINIIENINLISPKFDQEKNVNKKWSDLMSTFYEADFGKVSLKSLILDKEYKYQISLTSLILDGGEIFLRKSHISLFITDVRWGRKYYFDHSLLLFRISCSPTWEYTGTR